jgi:hypothetical protein
MMPIQRKSRFTTSECAVSELKTLIHQSSQSTGIANREQSGLGRMVQQIEKVCNCRQLVVQQSRRRVFPGFEFFSRVCHAHRQDCPYFQSQTTTTASITFQFGVGDFSISPHLVLRGFAREDSPAFQLWHELGWYQARTLPECIFILRQLPTRLHLLFSQGKASPSEKDAFGGTLLHVSSIL